MAKKLTTSKAAGEPSFKAAGKAASKAPSHAAGKVTRKATIKKAEVKKATTETASSGKRAAGKATVGSARSISSSKPESKARPESKAKRAVTKHAGFSLADVLKELESLGSAAMRAQNAKSGAGENQFGVKRGDLRILANRIKANHDLAVSLWKTGNIDAQFLATLLIDVRRLSANEMDQMVRSAAFMQVADWLHSYVVKEHADKESLRVQWMATADPIAARAGWALTAGRVIKNPEGLNLGALLDRIENEMGTAAPETQWTMNTCLAAIGIHFPQHRKRALAIGEKLGVYRDYPCSKGCTSPFAPIWINEMVRRQG